MRHKLLALVLGLFWAWGLGAQDEPLARSARPGWWRPQHLERGYLGIGHYQGVDIHQLTLNANGLAQVPSSEYSLATTPGYRAGFFGQMLYNLTDTWGFNFEAGFGRRTSGFKVGLGQGVEGRHYQSHVHYYGGAGLVFRLLRRGRFIPYGAVNMNLQGPLSINYYSFGFNRESVRLPYSPYSARPDTTGGLHFYAQNYAHRTPLYGFIWSVGVLQKIRKRNDVVLWELSYERQPGSFFWSNYHFTEADIKGEFITRIRGVMFRVAYLFD